MKNLGTIAVVYGNHGKSPAQLEDYHSYLTQALHHLGYRPRFTEDVIPGQLNLLIECFNKADAFRVKQACEVPGTQFICIATEFITGETFNDFEGGAKRNAIRRKFRLPRWMELLGARTLPILFPEFMRALAIDYSPGPYFRMRDKYYAWFGFPKSSLYSMKNYWIDRFECFHMVAPYCDAIWCVTPHQLSEYQKSFGAKVKLMPIVSWIRSPGLSAYEKDIDFLFTGSITPYRQAVFDELRSRGYRVFTGPATLPSYLRDHYISRSKVCLQVRQDPNWRYPSIMRYHYLLCAGAVIVAEQTDESCMQEKFLKVVDPEHFVDECIAEINEGNFTERGLKACTSYYDSCEAGRNDFQSLLPSVDRTLNERILEPSLSHH